MVRRLLAKFQRERDLTAGSISKNLWVLALPMMVSNFLQTALNLVDMAWVGRLGPDALAAVSMSGSILMILMFLMMGVGMGTTALVARFVGAKQLAQAENVARQSLIMGFWCSLVFAVLGYFISPWLLQILGADKTVLLLGVDYMRIMFLGVVVMFYMFLISAILQGAGDTVTPMLVLALSVIINIVLDPLMIFGIGFPKMGVAGAALATVIAEGVGSLVALETLLKGRSRLMVKVANLKTDVSAMWRILKIGMPAALQMSLRGLMGVVLMAIVAGFGTYAVAAYGVGLRLSMLAMMPGFAFGAAAATLVGQNLGAQKLDRAKASAWLAVAYYSIFMIAIALVFVFFAPQLMLVFNDQPQVVNIGVEFLHFTALSALFVSVGLVLGRAISGSGDTLPVAVFTFVALWLIQVPLAYYLSRLPALGLRGVWLAILIAQIVLAALNTFWFQLGRWQHKRV